MSLSTFENYDLCTFNKKQRKKKNGIERMFERLENYMYILWEGKTFFICYVFVHIRGCSSRRDSA